MGRPKALLLYQGETFVDRLNGIMTARMGSAAIVVLGYHADIIRGGMVRAAMTVMNPDPARGQLSSLQCGLSMLPPGINAFLFTPVDCPALRPETIDELLSSLEGDPHALMAIPSYNGRHGHPVVCRAAMSAEFLALPPDASAKEAIRANWNRAVVVETNDPGVLSDIDDPAAYEKLMEISK